MSRKVLLNDEVIYLKGKRPAKGTRIAADFKLLPARCADKPLSAQDISKGCVIISTLPNIQKHACMRQILDLEHSVKRNFKGACLVHVSSDEIEHWKEVDELHPNLKAKAYTLNGAEKVDIRSFSEAFGVSVEGHHRIAHGIFGLKDGKVLTSMIPRQQMVNSNVSAFVGRFKKAIKDTKNV